MPDVLLGFGGNLGDVSAAIAHAVEALRERGITVQALSHLYRTAPWGPVSQPDFINACALASTEHLPRDCLALTQALEREGGRVESERWGPRTLDIDILTYGNLALATPDLTLPHPHLAERAFVLVPLSEVAPDWIVAGRSVRNWAEHVDRTGVEIFGPPPPLRS